MFRVNPKTVTRWHRTGKMSAIRTLGGHRRFRASEIRRLLAEGEPLRQPSGRRPAADTAAARRSHGRGERGSGVAGTGVDPVTSRFSGARSAN